jgi:IS5 family transposase
MIDADQQQLLADQHKRSEVEGMFGTGKGRYSLNLIIAILKAGS